MKQQPCDRGVDEIVAVARAIHMIRHKHRGEDAAEEIEKFVCSRMRCYGIGVSESRKKRAA